MLVIIDELKNLLEKDFPGSVVILKTTDSGKITGSVWWEGFRGVEVKNRNKTVRSVINKLGYKEHNVGFVSPMVGKEKT